MKGQFTRDDGGDLWMYIAPHHTGYWKFVDADDNWVDRGMALQVTGEAAALFEAAPEMLAVLRDAKSELIYLYEEVYPDDESDNDTTEVIDRVIAAINKAEGRVE